MRWTWFLMLPWCLGCGDPLHPTQVIEKTRVIGARASVVADPARATPARGEAAMAEFWVADPGVPAPLQYALAVCLRDQTTAGVPGCASPAFATSVGAGDPELNFTPPSDLPQGASLLALGVICANSAPQSSDVLGRWPDDLGCTQGGQSARVQFDVFLRPEVDNDNPTLSDETISFDEQTWDAVLPADLSAPCAGSSPTAAANGATHRVRVAVSADDRETNAEGSELSALSSFSTGGKLSRAFSFIEADSAADSVTLEWEAPETAPVGGRFVSFFFVLRDGRGGADFSRRALCVVP